MKANIERKTGPSGSATICRPALFHGKASVRLVFRDGLANGPYRPKTEVPRRLPSGRNPCKPKFAGSGMGFSSSFQESDGHNPRRLQAHTRGCDQLHTE